MSEYSSSEVLQRSGATYRQLDHWCRSGYLGERLAAPAGSGTTRTFSWKEMNTVVYAAKLIKLGFTPKAAIERARVVAENGESVLSLPGLSVRISRIDPR